MLTKARSGRRLALMLRSVRKATSDQTPDQTDPKMFAERPVQHQFLQRITLSENRVSRLANA